LSRLLNGLERKGYVRRLHHRARGIQLVYAEDHCAPNCLCGGCADARYLAQLKLIQGLKVLPPVAVMRAIGSNIRPLPNTTRDAFPGIESRGPAPCTRKRAIPRSAS